MTEVKPLNWKPKPGVGMTVVRRGDGGMTLTFTDLSDATLNDWRECAMEHLLGATGRTRNLYDLRAVKEIPEQAILGPVRWPHRDRLQCSMLYRRASELWLEDDFGPVELRLNALLER